MFSTLPVVSKKASCTCSWVSAVSVSIITWPSLHMSLHLQISLSLQGHFTESKALNSGPMLILYSSNCLHLQIPYFQIRSHSQVLVVSTWAYLWEDTRQSAQQIVASGFVGWCYCIGPLGCQFAYFAFTKGFAFRLAGLLLKNNRDNPFWAQSI